MITVSTTKDRQKFRNLIANPAVAFTLVDPERPLRYIEIRGKVTIKEDPDAAIRTSIGHKHDYAGGGAALDSPGTERVALIIYPTRVIAVHG